MANNFAETWEINNRINLMLLESIAEEQLADKLNGGGKSVGAQIAHIHQARLFWLDGYGKIDVSSMEKIAKDQTENKTLLKECLGISNLAMIDMFEKLNEKGGVTGYNNLQSPLITFLGYTLAHEAHHRGQIMLTLKSNGHLPDKALTFGIWEWGKI
ncbi:MAG: hypothetical protein NTX03_07385 [Bacteroidetes bacterium]|nr:hypothetical protein [Bacteroidota bacterium]